MEVNQTNNNDFSKALNTQRKQRAYTEQLVSKILIMIGVEVCLVRMCY